MHPRLIILISLVILTGCQPNPRYRSGEARPPGSEDNPLSDEPSAVVPDRDFISVSTNDLLELGRIIQSCLGKPYSGTSQYEKGLDCSQFTLEVFERFKRIKLPRTTARQFKTGQRINKSRLRFGDLVFFATEGNDISHVGIFVGNDEFVHSSSSSGIIISNINDEYWRKHFAGGRRILP
nr:C40 family peptidase [candidate division Zixibacteria bacterium]